MNGETFEANHRCEGSLNARCRIVKGLKLSHWTLRDRGWNMYIVTYDYIDNRVNSIKFCPFCGKELE